MELKKLGKLRRGDELTKEESKIIRIATFGPEKPWCCSHDCKEWCKDMTCMIMLLIGVIVVCEGLVFLGYYLGGGFDKK